MASRLPFDDRYKWPIRAGVIWMILLCVFSGLTLDMGEAGEFYLCSISIYIPVLLLILFRRPAKPTTADLLVIKWGLPILYFAGFLVYPYAWHLRGLR